MAAIVLVFGFMSYLNPFRVFDPVRKTLWFVVEPFAHGVFFAASETRDFFRFLSSISTMKAENSRLVAENISLMVKNAALESAEAENASLRELLKVLPKGKYDLETATVIGGNPNGPGEWLIINKGSGSGIRGSMPVIAYDGVLVGRVENVEFSSARVQLLSSQDSVVNVRTLSTNAKGIVRGRFGLGMILEMVLQTDTLSAGDRIFTSDISSEYPSGMFVGEVRDVTPSPNSLFQQATVIAPVSYSDLRFVSVVKKSN